ncbi:hypothetical protein N9437_03135 [Acidimicrobiia bacterium]|nr:hypothetical protein [Acidimicrobiia bacterium]
MTELILFGLTLYGKYLLLFVYLFLLGRATHILVTNYMLSATSKKDLILETKSTVFYPIIGTIVLGNILIILNYFTGLGNSSVVVVSILLLIPNLIGIKNLSTISGKIVSIENIILYIVIPGILLISSSDINFHYDAAYYHLNHQNWLRESNLIIGTVNIFWPFGMSSIFEHLSAVLWFGNSLIYLHFLNLVFIHFFFSFIFIHLYKTRNQNLKYASLLILIFSFFDNFGISGGRNGFIYIQEIGKQDTAVAILYLITSILLLDKIQKKKMVKSDMVYFSLLVFFIFEIKVSGVIIFTLYFTLLYLLIRENIYTLKNLLYLQLPAIFFGLMWSIKSILTTGCLIFPLAFTCNDTFWWYEIGSTERVEEYTTSTSFSYMEYFFADNLSFVDWFNDFFFSSINNTFSNYYLAVYTNFLISLTLLVAIKQIFFNKKILDLSFKLITGSYVLLSIFYLIFYGPIPRYSMGILCTMVGLIGFFIESEKIKIPKTFVIVLFIFSLGLFPRLSSYQNFLNNKDVSLFDPRIEAQYNDIEIGENWVRPDSGDRCWINLKCTMEDKNIVIIDEDYFKVAYKED